MDRLEAERQRYGPMGVGEWIARDGSLTALFAGGLLRLVCRKVIDDSLDTRWVASVHGAVQAFQDEGRFENPMAACDAAVRLATRLCGLAALDGMRPEA